MKINVDVPLMKQQAKDLLLNDTYMKYEFVGIEGTFMQFEVTAPADFTGDVVEYTKKQIKNTDWGVFTAFRVLHVGQMYSGQRNY